ncbi:TetR/AcrR family transcriptional regulator [Ginsengibacter hankyongi]|uniref:TetR/AcrR family transcriptional regulator n=1 Tax=Ginsengibacter hankyongi TaxID=2607284 RepID=A0A5J5IHD7_9BACT|nr:TetR family transcriptional regulator [Ginsengibacter hankyongi]KAA9039524.1 TetR/AcrR family transcriptional regulator [Ginsengibacter hankyongi]
MDKKEAILSTAMKLFGQKGFEGTSVREIAADADVNPAMISYYFGSKEKLFEKLVEHKAAFLKGVFAELVNNRSLTQLEKLFIVIDNYVDKMFQSPQFHHLLHRELSLERRPQMKNAISEILLRNFVSVRKIIQEGIESGEFNTIDPELTIASIIGTINHLLSSEIMCRKILQKNKDFNPYQSKKLKERISEHLKQLMRSHVLRKNNQTI